MKKVFLVLFIASLSIVSFMNVNVDVNNNSFSFQTLAGVEAEACCQMQESNGYSQWCHCNYSGYCPCLSGWSTGRAFFH